MKTIFKYSLIIFTLFTLSSCREDIVKNVDNPANETTLFLEKYAGDTTLTKYVYYEDEECVYLINTETKLVEKKIDNNSKLLNILMTIGLIIFFIIVLGIVSSR